MRAAKSRLVPCFWLLLIRVPQNGAMFSFSSTKTISSGDGWDGSRNRKLLHSSGSGQPRDVIESNVTHSYEASSFTEHIAETDSILEREIRLVESVGELYRRLNSISIDVMETATRIIYLSALHDLAERVTWHTEAVRGSQSRTGGMIKIVMDEIGRMMGSEQSIVINSTHSISLNVDPHTPGPSHYRSLLQVRGFSSSMSRSKSRGNSGRGDDDSSAADGRHSTKTVTKQKSVHVDFGGSLNGLANLVGKAVQASSRSDATPSHMMPQTHCPTCQHHYTR